MAKSKSTLISSTGVFREAQPRNRFAASMGQTMTFDTSQNMKIIPNLRGVVGEATHNRHRGDYGYRSTNTDGHPYALKNTRIGGGGETIGQANDPGTRRVRKQKT